MPKKSVKNKLVIVESPAKAKTIEKISENKIGEVLNSRAIYNLAALEYKADHYVDLQGMDYHPTAKQYIAIQVDDSGKVTIDMENLQNLLHINSKKSNETNKVKFNITQ